MKRSKRTAAAIRLLLAALAIAAAGCSGKQNEPAVAPEPAAISNIPKVPVDASTVGSVKGTVRFAGAPPKMRTIHMNAVPNCAKQYSSPPMTEDVVPGETDALANAVVYLQGDFGRYSFAVPSTPLVIDQKGCRYAPHVAAVMAGAPIEFLNSDDAGHNIHPVPKTNREWNQSQPGNGAPIVQSFAREEIAIPIKCNVHPWMRAYVAVLSHPYFQVTGMDGAFELKNVPPGNYTLTVWHEYYGSKSQPITIGVKQQQTAEITLSR